MNNFYHHGILGQKWGKKNGPPYPLSPSDHSSSEKKAGWRKSLTKEKEKDQPNTRKKYSGLSDKQKTALKIGVAAAGTALAIYGAYKLGESDKLGDLGLKGVAVVDRIIGKNKGAGDFVNDIDDLAVSTGFSKNVHQISIEESCKKVNPNYVSGDNSYKQNCFSAVTADLFNRVGGGKGLDVHARPATAQEIKSRGISFNDMLKPYSGSMVDDLIIKKTEIGDAKNAASREILNRFGKTDSFGIIRVHSAKDSAIGHYIKWEVLDGSVYFSDSLSGTVGADKYFNGVSSGRISRGLEISKVSDLAVNPFELEKLVQK